MKFPLLCFYSIIFNLLPLPFLSPAHGLELFRQADLYGDLVVFSSGGDLWTTSVNGAIPKRLTDDPGVEIGPKLSPNGQWIAFTGHRHGDAQVYVVPVRGGDPRQLTFYPAWGPLPPRWGTDHRVVDWTADGSGIVFLSYRESWTLASPKLFRVALEGGLPEPLPAPAAGFGALTWEDEAPAEMLLSSTARDFRSWGRYRGGWAQDLYRLDLEDGELQQLTTDPAADRDPVLLGSQVFFTSERNGPAELYRLDPEDGSVDLVASERPWDIRWPSGDGDHRIVYEAGGELILFDVAEGSRRPLAITLPPGAGLSTEIDVASSLEELFLSPDGSQVLLSGRGELFVQHLDSNALRPLGDSSASRERSPTWSPDGRWVAYISDATGDEELYIQLAPVASSPVAPSRANSASATPTPPTPPRRLTEHQGALLRSPRWSSDNRRIAYQDGHGALFVSELETRASEQIETGDRTLTSLPAWSPDGRFLAFSSLGSNGLSSIFLWDAADRTVYRLTDDLFDEREPVWSADGDQLYFLAVRDYAPQLGRREWNFVANRHTALFALPFSPALARSGPGGLAQRLERLLVTPGNYRDLARSGDSLLFLSYAATFYGTPPERPPALLRFELSTQEVSTVREGVYAYSAGGRRLLAVQGAGLVIRTLDGSEEPRLLDLGGATRTVDLQAEWGQIFDEVVRRYRELARDPSVQQRLPELAARYRPLVQRLRHREDLNELLGRLLFELGLSHSYVSGGDALQPSPPPPTPLLGATFELDPATQLYRFAEILPGHNTEPRYRSPLTVPGLADSQPAVAVGSYLLEVGGRPLRGTDNPYQILQQADERPLELLISPTPSRDSARKIVVDPVSDERKLHYLRWVLANRRAVDRLSGGRIAYLHLPDMGADGLWEFNKWFYGQTDRPALLVDLRFNGGGDITPMVLERIARPLLAHSVESASPTVTSVPRFAFDGPKACLINEITASQGEFFAAYFRALGLGPLIGARTWGGALGNSSQEALIDGGTVLIPEAQLIPTVDIPDFEGIGITPDLEVPSLPPQGPWDPARDAQLEAAVQVLLEELEELESEDSDPDSIRAGDQEATKSW